jgi:hypothetical protein
VRKPSAVIGYETADSIEDEHKVGHGMRRHQYVAAPYRG